MLPQVAAAAQNKTADNGVKTPGSGSARQEADIGDGQRRRVEGAPAARRTASERYRSDGLDRRIAKPLFRIRPYLTSVRSVR